MPCFADAILVEGWENTKNTNSINSFTGYGNAGAGRKKTVM
jgi:hypothetical protein